MPKNIKPKLIAFLILILFTAGAVRYVQYLMNEPLNIEIPKHFTYNGTKIALAWTDDNTGENLIIQSDKKEYNGFSSVDVYFSITNISRRDQDADVVIWLPSEKSKAEKIERINEDGSNFEFPILNFEINSNFEFPNRKDIGGSDNGYVVNDKIESGQTNYYKATIKYPPMSKGEFFIEAFGLSPRPPLLTSPLTPLLNRRGEPKEDGDKLPSYLGGAGGGMDKWARGGQMAYGHLDPWYSSDWGYRRPITINASQVATTTSAFPVLATTTLADLKTTTHDGKVASSTGADIVFADSAGDILNYEREYYASTTGEIAYWIKTDISSSTDTVLYMYYGNSSMSADLANPTGVWDDNFVMVQHMSEDPTDGDPAFKDSTSNDNDGTDAGDMTTEDQVDGQIDGSLDFDGSGDRVIFGGDAGINLGTINSASIWINLNSVYTAAYIGHKNYNDGGYILGASATDLIYMAGVGGYSYVTVTHGLSTGQWANLAVSRDGTAVKFYKNGQQLGITQTLDNNREIAVSTIGAYYEGGSPTHGIIDEVRISNVARTAGWIETEYNNQVSVGDFMTFGAEEENEVAPTITSVTDSPDPAQHSTTITFSVDWNDADAGETIKVKICKTDSLTGQNCDGGHYASSTAFTTDDPAEATYAVLADDFGTKNYYAFVCDDDGNCSGSTHGTFTVRITQISSPYTDSGNWYNANWKYKRAIVLEADQISTTTDAFPVLATTTLADLKSYAYDGNVASNDGHDIIFVDDDNTTLLNFEREYYDPATGEIAYWIKTDISSTTDKTIYMYYGSSASSDQATTTGVWDDNYVMVNHLAHDGVATTTYPDFNDSTKYNNDGSSKNMNSDDLVDGQIDGALDFDGGDDYVNLPNDIVPVTTISSDGVTLSAWVKIDTLGTRKSIVGQKAQATNSDFSSGGIRISLANKANMIVYNGAYKYLEGTTVLNTTNKYHITGIFNPLDDQTRIYVNGNLENTSVGNSGDFLAGINVGYIGIRHLTVHSYFFDGLIDEVRISNVARTAGWIETEYNNQVSVGDFMTFGAEESLNRVAIVNAPITNYLTDGLVGHWTFNGQDMDWSATDAEAIDRSGQGNDGNVIGASVVSGKVGQGLEFDGVGDYVITSALTELGSTNNLTMTAWFKANTKNGYDAIVGNRPSSLQAMIISGAASLPLTYCWENTQYDEFQADTGLTFNTGVFYFGSVVIEPTKATVYLGDNGTLSSYINTKTHNTKNVNVQWEIGRDGDGNRHFDGIIDEVRIYNRALSADEIGELYRVGARKMRIKN